MPTYVYGITRTEHPLRLDDVRGVGADPDPLRTVRAGELAAVVSDAPPGLRAKRRDLHAHQSVLEALMADGATLPMRFGLLAPDDSQVATALETDRNSYHTRLTELDGHVEYNLKAARDEDDLLSEIVSQSEQVRRLREFTRTTPEAQQERVALGELISQEVAARNAMEVNRLTERLSSWSTHVSAGEPGVSHFLSLSFLVPDDEKQTFVEAVRREADERGDTYSFTLTGPLPPYSFV